MKVWIVWESELWEPVSGVFSSLEKAQEYCKKNGYYYPESDEHKDIITGKTWKSPEFYSKEIDEFELDPE